MKKKMRSVYEDIVANGNNKNLCKKFSFEERLMIHNIFCDEYDNMSSFEVFENLFSEEEALTAYKDNDIQLYAFLDEEKRMKNIEIFIDNSEILLDWCVFKNKNNIDKIIKKLIDKEKILDWNNLLSYGKCLSLNMNEKEIEKYSKILGEIDQNVDFLTLRKYIKEEMRDKIIMSMLLEKLGMNKEEIKNIEDSKDIVVGSLVSLIKNMNKKQLENFCDSEIFSYIMGLEKDDRNRIFIEVINKSTDLGLYCIDSIVSLLPFEERMNFIGSIPINNFSLDTNDIIEILANIDKKSWIELIDLFNVAFNYNYDAEYIIATLIYSEEDEERKNYLFEKFVLNDPNIEPAYLFGSLCEVPELEYRLMDKYFLCKGNKMTVQKAVDLIDYNGDKVDFFKNYPNIVDYFVEQFEIKNKKHFEYIIKKFGNKTFTFLNDNIVNLINLNDEDFNKIMAIFEKENLSLDRVSTEAVITSIVQKRFMIDKNNIYNIFSSFESWINKKDLESIDKCLKKIDFTSKIKIENLIKKGYEDYETFLNDLLNKNELALNILHNITNEFIKHEREKYNNENKDYIKEKLNFKKKYSKKYIKKEFWDKEDVWKIYSVLRSKKIKLSKEEKELINNTELLYNAINYKQELKKGIRQKDKELAGYIDIIDGILDRLYEVDFFEEYYSRNDTKHKLKNIEYTYIPIQTLNEDILEILANINVGCVVEKLINDKKLFNDFINNYVSKYKFLGWNNNFKELFEDADCTFDTMTVSNMINYFYSIYPKVKGKSLTSFIDYANCYGSSSRKYKILFGKEDYELITANSGKNKAALSKRERFIRTVNLIDSMYCKTKTSIYPLNENIEVKGKSIHVNIGNFTNPMNLTYGERTNSCLRAGGAYEDLYNFCLTNENGFHIRFTSPITGKFVSRVSGVRNGNTVFLNELRESVDEEYSNEDVALFMHEVAKILVERTKDSKYPIENVIITTEYALDEKKYTNKLQKLNIENLYDALYGLNFDIKNDTGYVLYSAYKKNAMKYKFGKENSELYDSLDDDIKEEYNQSLIYEKIIRIHMIDLLLKGIKLQNIAISEIEQMLENFKPVKCIYGDCFYVCFDKEGNSREFIVKNIRKSKSERAKSKVEEVKKNAKNRKNKRV